jgi:hypothetical protein
MQRGARFEICDIHFGAPYWAQRGLSEGVRNEVKPMLFYLFLAESRSHAAWHSF